MSVEGFQVTMRWKTIYVWVTILSYTRVCYTAFPWTNYICIGGKSTSTVTIGISDIQCLHKCYGELENEPEKYKALLYGNNTCYCMLTPNLEDKSDSRGCKYVVFQGDSKMLKTNSMYFVETHSEVTSGAGGRLKIFYFTNTESTSEAMVFAIDSLNTTTPSNRFIPSRLEFHGSEGAKYLPSREALSNLTNTVLMRTFDIDKEDGRTIEIPFKMTRYLLAIFQVEVNLTVMNPSTRAKSFSTVLKTSSYKQNREEIKVLNASSRLMPEIVNGIKGYTLQIRTEDGKIKCIGDPENGWIRYKVRHSGYCTSFRVYQRTFMDTKGYCMNIKDGAPVERIKCFDLHNVGIMITRSSPEMHLYISDSLIFASKDEKNQFERVKIKFGWGTPPTEHSKNTPYNATSSTLDETSLICVHKYKNSVDHCIHLSSGVFKKITLTSYYTHYYGNIICGQDTWNNNYCTDLKTGKTMIKTDKKISAMNLMLKYSNPNITMNRKSSIYVKTSYTDKEQTIC